VAGLLLKVGVFLAFSAFALLLIFVHELGHFAAGSLCRLRLSRFRVGPVELQCLASTESRSDLVWKWNWQWDKPGSGGVVMFATQRSMQGLGLRYFTFVAGGPLANLCCALLAIPLWENVGPVAGTVKLFSAGSALICAVNLIPFTRRNLTSDGRRLWDLCFSRKKRETIFYVLTVPERFNEIRSLHIKGNLQEACNRADALIEAGECLPDLPAYLSLRKMIGELKQARSRGVLFGELPKIPDLDQNPHDRSEDFTAAQKAQPD